MGTSRSLLPLRLPAAAGALLALFLLAGSLADYPLSCALYDPQNPFGRFFAVSSKGCFLTKDSTFFRICGTLLSLRRMVIW